MNIVPSRYYDLKALLKRVALKKAKQLDVAHGVWCEGVDSGATQLRGRGERVLRYREERGGEGGGGGGGSGGSGGSVDIVV